MSRSAMSRFRTVSPWVAAEVCRRRSANPGPLPVATLWFAQDDGRLAVEMNPRRTRSGASDVTRQ
jgi:hypothetical protein